MSAFDQLQKASFAGFVFPVSEMTVSCSLREHVHIYPHAPGGQPEKLGRNLYEFKMTAPMHGTLLAYPKLWPETMASLRVMFEGGGTFDLVVPTIGTISAYCVNWTERMTAKQRSGVTAEMAFREDSSELFLVTELIAARTAATFAARSSFQAQAAEAEIEEDVFDLLVEAITALERVKGRFEQEAYVVAAKAESVVALCERAGALPVLDNPEHFAVLNALRDVHFSAVRLMLDAGKGAARTVVSYTVPVTMSVSVVSKNIYGNTSRSLEIMRLNAIPNPLAIPGGTTLRVYSPEPQPLARAA